MLTRLDVATVLCVAVALTCWPAGRTAAARLAALFPRPHTPWRIRVRLTDRRLLAMALLPAIPLLGPADAIAAGLLAAAGWCHYRVYRRGKAKAVAAESMAEALRTTIAELRTGAPPALAAEVAAADASGHAAVVMRKLAGSARHGGELAADDQLGKAWSLSRRHGLPLAELLDAVRRDVVANARFTARANASMSGPRASSAVLAALPSVGLLLGEAMGARPLHVLTGTSIGQVLLVGGSALILAGAAWSARLTSTLQGRVAGAKATPARSRAEPPQNGALR